jgi:hypothetical protein
MATGVWVLRQSAAGEGDDSDHTAIFDASDALDQVADTLGVARISEFFDWTDFDANMSADEPLEDYEYVAAARWFDPAEALPALKALLSHLQANPSAAESPDWDDLYRPVLAELEDVVLKVRRAADEGTRFNLCVVMLSAKPAALRAV